MLIAHTSLQASVDAPVMGADIDSSTLPGRVGRTLVLMKRVLRHCDSAKEQRRWAEQRRPRVGREGTSVRCSPGVCQEAPSERTGHL